MSWGKGVLVSTAIVFLVFTGCAGEKPTQKEPGVNRSSTAEKQLETTAEYFPAEAGLYKRFADSRGGREEWVEKGETYNGRQVVPIHTKMLNPQASPAEEGGEYEVSDYTNLYVVGQEVLLIGTRAKVEGNKTAEDAIPVPSVIFKTGLKQGQSWTYELYNPPGKVLATVENFSSLTTKAGVFERTAKIRLDYVFLEPGGQEVRATAYEWYAPGYGMVKSQGEMGTEEVVEVKKER